MAQPLLHSFREIDSKDRHCLAEYLCNSLHKHESGLEKLLILLSEDRSIVVILVELLRKLICVVCYECWRMCCASLCNLCRESIEYLDDTNLLRREFNSCVKYVCSMGYTLFISLSENRLDTCMRVLDERTCISVEID